MKPGATFHLAEAYFSVAANPDMAGSPFLNLNQIINLSKVSLLKSMEY
jgi:hypothetical protein